jgi:putative MATE family efflux protein
MREGSTMRNSMQKVMRWQVLTLAWPIVLEMSGVMLTGVVTTAMVGRLGAVALTAVGIATMVQFASAMVIAAFGTGASALVGKESGAGQWAQVRRTTGQALLIGLLLGLVLAVVGYICADGLFLLIGAEPDVVELAGRLLKVLFLFTPVYLLMVIGNAVLRGLSKTKTAFYIGTFSNLLSLLLAFLLIFGIGLPAMGAMGAAWGTAVAQLCGGIVAMLAIARDPHIRLRWRTIFAWHPATIRRILEISVPAAVEQAALQGGRVFFTFMLAGVGAVQFAAHQITVQIESVSFLPGFGFSVAVMAIVAQSLGKGRPDRASHFTKITAGLAFVAMSLMGAVFFLFAESLTRLFIDDPQVIYWSTLCVMIAAFEQPTLALAYVFAGALRGAGDTRWPMYATILGVWVFRMPLVYLCVHVWQFGIVSVWIVTAIDFLLRSLVLWWRFRSGGWK